MGLFPMNVGGGGTSLEIKKFGVATLSGNYDELHLTNPLTIKELTSQWGFRIYLEGTLNTIAYDSATTAFTIFVYNSSDTRLGSISAPTSGLNTNIKQAYPTASYVWLQVTTNKITNFKVS